MHSGVEVLDSNYLAISALVTVGFQTAFFIIAAWFKFDKVTDFAGSTNFLVVALMTFFFRQTYYARQIAATVLASAWAVRLACYLFYRILKIGKDDRFDNTREDLLKFAVFWIFQAIWVFTVSLPLIFINSEIVNPELGVADYVGWSLFILGLLIETVGDQQKFNYKNNGGRKWCDVGLWRYSRHPNYCGEFFMWWGMFATSTSILSGGQWAAVASPLFIMTILLFGSGAPILEKSADAKFGADKDYVEYKRTTSPIILLPPALYGALPRFVKAVFLFEFPLYDNLIKESEPIVPKDGTKPLYNMP
eukprot:Colp12_sorted_trinity150504_noHs@13161